MVVGESEGHPPASGLTPSPASTWFGILVWHFGLTIWFDNLVKRFETEFGI